MNPESNLTRQLVRLAIRLPLAYGCMVLLFYLLGPLCVDLLMPLIRFEIRHFYSEQSIVESSLDKEIEKIIMGVQTTRNINDNGQVSRTKVFYKTAVSSNVVLLPALISISLLLAWPGLVIVDRLRALVLMLILLSLFLPIDIALTSIGIANQQLRGVGVWHHFKDYLSCALNSGGRQVFALFIFLLSVAPSFIDWKKFFIDKKKLGRNHPCPCGSGKKYKNCCLK